MILPLVDLMLSFWPAISTQVPRQWNGLLVGQQYGSIVCSRKIKYLYENKPTRATLHHLDCIFYHPVGDACPVDFPCACCSKPVGIGWAEVCTSTSLKVVKVPNEQVPKPFSFAKHDRHFEYYPFCQTQADTFGPPTVVVVLFKTSGSFLLPSLFYQSLHPLFVWAITQSRTPHIYS